MSLSHYASEYTSRKPECSLWSALSYYHAWSKTINADYHPLNARKPWINYPATAFISSHLQSGQSVFEYGSGGSTIYFLDKGLSVTSIEHDSKWFDIISRAVGKHKHSAAWTGFIREASVKHRITNTCDWADPDAYVSSSRYHQDQDFRNYVQAIDAFEGKRFDLVMIDGRSRPSCVKHAVSKVRAGGFLMIDNTERSHYVTSRTLRYLRNFRLVHDCYGPTAGLMNFTRTSIWQFPS